MCANKKKYWAFSRSTSNFGLLIGTDNSALLGTQLLAMNYSALLY